MLIFLQVVKTWRRVKVVESCEVLYNLLHVCAHGGQKEGSYLQYFPSSLRQGCCLQLCMPEWLVGDYSFGNSPVPGTGSLGYRSMLLCQEPPRFWGFELKSLCLYCKFFMCWITSLAPLPLLSRICLLTMLAVGQRKAVRINQYTL